ncbi:hypothetical protein [Paraburkholderia fynbosensis]|uniref:Uncharacterized protein n=1 Tax=Paraburkholderia fynbosensis TaxID=1200993 RepID=A0A6J5FKW7_9BURK|nr:hypothetical protein [Paraburkholderia fynbosensis]CAB3782297.1 hypothetical protein LMG27177_01208 [Paraburkholderia fynbosensis]
MARPIGIFGALMALGGFLAVRYVQSKRAAKLPSARELSRWEGEGGAVATPASPAAGLATASASPDAHAANGPAHTNGDGRAWPFPRS